MVLNDGTEVKENYQGEENEFWSPISHRTCPGICEETNTLVFVKKVIYNTLNRDAFHLQI